MFRVEVNSEYQLEVVVNFEDMENYLEECVDIIEELPSIFKNISNDCIDEPQDYHYLIECSSKEEANKVEDYLYSRFEELEEEFYGDFEEEFFEEEY